MTWLPSQPPAAAVDKLNTDIGAFVTFAAVAEALAAPDEQQRTEICRDYAELAYETWHGPLAGPALAAAIPVLLLQIRLSLTVETRTGQGMFRRTPEAFFAEIVRAAPQLSAHANRVLGLLIEHDPDGPETPFIAATLNFMKHERDRIQAAFEVLVLLMGKTVQQHGPGDALTSSQAMDRWLVLGQVGAIAFPLAGA